MDQQTHENHYVPIWYQKRFLPEPGARFFYLDLSPTIYRNGPGKSVSKRVPKSSFKKLISTLPGLVDNPMMKSNVCFLERSPTLEPLRFLNWVHRSYVHRKV
jgi:hypothetical protein